MRDKGRVMRKILWIGEPYFAGSLQTCGWEEVAIRPLDKYRLFDWPALVRLAGFEPDVLVVGDTSHPPFVIGVEDFPCLTVFYSVDSHIHSWHPYYAQAFDAALVSLADNVSKFAGDFLPSERIWWSPAFAHDDDLPDPCAEKKWDCLFVGTDNADLMPQRHRFLAELGQRLPGLHVTSGNYRKLFPQGRVLVNQAEHGDLNFRVFEALGCGCCLVTPRIGNGLDKLFVDGEQLVCYKPGDAGDAAYRINFLLENPDLCQYIAETGLAEINARHRARHRAEAFTDHMCDMVMNGPEALVSARKEKAAAIRKRYLELPYLLWAKEMPDYAAAFLSASHGQFKADQA